MFSLYEGAFDSEVEISEDLFVTPYTVNALMLWKHLSLSTMSRARKVVRIFAQVVVAFVNAAFDSAAVSLRRNEKSVISLKK